MSKHPVKKGANRTNLNKNRSEFEQKTGVTSDHLPQSIIIQGKRGKNSYTFTVTTWNMMDECTAPNPNTKYPGNNPVGVDEKKKEKQTNYECRRLRQIKELEELIEAKSAAICLQEVDFYLMTFDKQKGKLVPRHPNLRNEFKQMLSKNGWQVVATEHTVTKPSDGSIRHTHQSQLILYDASKFELQSKPPSYFVPTEQIKSSPDGKQLTQIQDRAFAAYFKERSSGERVIIASMHLKYATKEVTNSILDFMRREIIKGGIIIIIGDANTIPGIEITLQKTAEAQIFLGNWKHATNFDAEGKRAPEAKLTTSHPVPSLSGIPHASFQKCYDVSIAGCGPSSELTLLECNNPYFLVDSTNPRSSSSSDSNTLKQWNLKCRKLLKESEKAINNFLVAQERIQSTETSSISNSHGMV